MSEKMDNIRQIAPVILFCYNRVDTLKRTVNALKNNILANETLLYIYSDGPKNIHDDKVNDVRNYIHTITGFKNINIVEQTDNLGLSKSIINGVTEIIKKHGRVIVVEDDLISSCYFLQFMNEALDFYEDDDRVISIHGYLYPVTKTIQHPFFLRGADCWGWATWERGWELFEKNGTLLLSELKNRNLSSKFDLDGSYGFTKLLQQQSLDKVDSWAIRWHASAFLQEKLTLYPNKSLIKNIGFDNLGVNCGTTSVYDVDITDVPIVVSTISVWENIYMRNEVKQFFKRMCKSQRMISIGINKFKKIIERFLDVCLIPKSKSVRDYISNHNNRFGHYIVVLTAENITLNQVLGDYRFFDLRKDDIVLDIGANVGGFSMLVCNSVKQVFVVEPLFTNILRQNIENNNINNIMVLGVGLGSGTLNCEFMSRKANVECLSLSKIIKKCGGKVDFFKCDCEGGEWCIQAHELKGIRRIEAEIHSFNGEKLSDFSDMLLNCGYEVDITDNNGSTMMIHAALIEVG